MLISEKAFRSLVWIKSSFSGSTDCVMLARVDENVIAMRNSRNDESAVLFTDAEISAFILGAKDNQFDEL